MYLVKIVNPFTPSYSTLCWLRLKYHFVVTKLGHSHSVSKVTMTQEDELRLGADGYLQKLLTRKTVLDHIWNGFKFTCIFFSLVCLSNGYMCILKNSPNSEHHYFSPQISFWAFTVFTWREAWISAGPPAKFKT